MQPIADVLVPLAAFAMVVSIIYVIVDSFRRRQQLRMVAEFHSKLLDRVGSAVEFGEFLNTDGGARFLDSLSIERATGGAHVRILRAVQAGLVSLVLGLGLFGYVTSVGNGLASDTAEGLSLFATIVLSIGIGLLLAAAVSYRLSKRLGLLEAGVSSGSEQGPTA